MRRSATSRLLAFCLLAAAPFVAAQEERRISDEYSKLIHETESVKAVDEGMFGEEVSLSNGSTEFSGVDLSIPGNSSLSVALGRRLPTEERTGHLGGFGDWDIDVPYITGTFAKGVGWINDTGTPGARCSQPGSPKGTYQFPATAFWHGYSMNIPGAGSQQVLRAVPGDTPAGPAGGVNQLLTKQRWYFTGCPTVTDGSATGEGFEVTSPDGTKYTFDHLIEKDTRGLSGGYWAGGVFYTGHGGTGYKILRSKMYFVATKVVDRFGNQVTYTWNGDRLTSITGSDGRQITLSHNGDGDVVLATGGGRAVTYAYVGEPFLGSLRPMLSTVTHGDGSVWSYSASIGAGDRPFEIKHEMEVQLPHDYNECTFDSAYGQTTYTVTHPSGAVGVFNFESWRHYRSYLPKKEDNCLPETGTPGRYLFPPYSDVLSLKSRTVTGPGLGTEVRSYAYESAHPLGSFQNNCTPQSTGFYCSGTKLTKVTDPDGTLTVYTFGNRWNVNEGQQLKVETGPLGAPVKTIVQAYVQNEEVDSHPFADDMGSSMHSFGDNFNAELVRPQKATSILLDGAAFNNEVFSFDAYGNAACVRKYTAGSASVDNDLSKYERTTYGHNTALWILSQLKRVELVGSCAVNAPVITEIQENSYSEPTPGTEDFKQLKSFERFNDLQQSFEYDPTNGALMTKVTEPGKPSATLGSYYRGVPRSITLPDTRTLSATVNDFGLPLSVTDQLGFATNYTYDTVGRLANTIYPTGDSTAWNTTQRTFSKNPLAEYGLPANHWKHTATTGSGRTTVHYDGHLRPVVKLTEIVGNPASKSYAITLYDKVGRETYQSYPVGSVGNIYVDPLPAGTVTTYDLIGRPKRVEQDSELGKIATVTDYLSGFRTQVTNPEGNVTTTSFQTFDQPTTDAPSRIQLPEAVTVDFDRDEFHKPFSIKRSGTHAGAPISATRYFVYDLNERLCKRVNPESLAEIVDYDAAGNIAWRAQGSGYTSTVEHNCQSASVPASAKVTYAYDAMNRVTHQVTPNGVGNLTYTYFADGQVESIGAGNMGAITATNSYTYNRRRLLMSETLAQPGNTWTVTHAYNANGHEASMSYPATVTYPTGLLVDYTPDALGRPTKAGTFASGISYWTSGAIKQFTYGNGVVHTMTQNVRGLPTNSRDAFGATEVIDDTYLFDKNGNVLAIDDGAQAGATSRVMEYDNLDRLLEVESPLWGTATYTYDALDNLRTSTVGAAGFTYGYDAAKNRLTTLTRSGGGQVYTYVTDGRGNITNDGRQTYQFDMVNRVLQVIGKESYRYDGLGRRTMSARTGSQSQWMYAKDGRVLFQHDTRAAKRTYNVYLGNTLVAEAKGGLWTGSPEIRYLHTDALGSPVAKSYFNQLGALQIDRTNYAPYGAPMTPVDGLGYTGHAMDLDTQLIYAQQRYFDPNLGRFLSVDPIPVDGTDGHNFNSYWYANDNPYVFKDPDGRLVNLAAGGIGLGVGAAVGLAIEGGKQLYKGEFDGEALLVEGGKGAVVGGSIGLTMGGSLLVTGGVAFLAGTGADQAGEAYKGNERSLADSAKVGAVTAGGALLGPAASNLAGKVTPIAVPATRSNAVVSARGLRDGGIFYTANAGAQKLADPVADKAIGRVAGEVTTAIGTEKVVKMEKQ